MPMHNGVISGDYSGFVVVIGAQWGDEGKGKLVDLLAEHAQAVCRCQGGNNAGHTVIKDGKEYFFHLLPSGMVNSGVRGVIGNGTVVHLPSLFKEIEDGHAKGLKNLDSRLSVSDRCHLVFDMHQMVDGLEEELRGSKSIGTTKKGIGPTYSSKVTRNGLRMCDLVGDWSHFITRYTELATYAKRRYPGLSLDLEATLEQLKNYRERISGMVCDTVSLVHRLGVQQNGLVLVEGAQSCMLDVDFGTYPHVTSSNCSVGGVCTGLGIPPSKLGPVFGVIKAYTTRVGSGPFPTELEDEIGCQLQQVGKEWGVTTKRRRRVGWMDTMIVKYANMINGFRALALTKLDVLDQLAELRIATQYQDPETGAVLDTVPASSIELARVKVIYQTLPGWQSKTAGCTVFEDLPAAAQHYVLTVEQLCGVPIRWIGTGPSRKDVIIRDV